jgi:hypothetical protein
LSDPHHFMNADDRLQNDINIFVRDAMSGEWRGCAHELRDAAELVWEERGNQLRFEVLQRVEIVKGKPKRRTESRKVYSASRPYILLAGFALENIMKVYLVACDSSSISDGKLRDDLKTHALINIAARIDGIALSENEDSARSRSLTYPTGGCTRSCSRTTGWCRTSG